MAQWKTITVLVVVLLMACCGFIFAQNQKSSPPRGGGAAALDPRMEQAIDMMFREMDTDHDGKISKAEWMAFQEKQFKMLDKNGDGFITKDEVREKMREDQERRAMTPK
ncbi:MAG: EF-hand domain-containing protein [Syntrophobacteraceae bacterium]